jgi:predicted small secreted protein
MSSLLKLLLFALAAGALLLTSCNTVSGFGQDMQRAGEGLERSSERHSY